MLLDYIARFSKFLWLALVLIIFLKIILSYSFNESLRGFNGALFAIFKWYGQQEQEMEDYEPRRIIMRLHNIITLFLYLVILLLVVATIFHKLLPH